MKNPIWKLRAHENTHFVAIIMYDMHKKHADELFSIGCSKSVKLLIYCHIRSFSSMYQTGKQNITHLITNSSNNSFYMFKLSVLLPYANHICFKFSITLGLFREYEERNEADEMKNKL